MSNEYLDLAGLTTYDSKLKDAIKTGKVLNIKNGNYHSIMFDGCHSSGTNSFAEGLNTQSPGDYSHAEGMETLADSEASHAEGSNTNAAGLISHAEGYGSIASGTYSHAEGYTTNAIAEASHAEGSNTNAAGDYSHAEGSNTNATGIASHAEGYGTIASGNYSHAEGYGTNAYLDNQTVVGNYNSNLNNALFIVGDGSSESERHNAFAVTSNTYGINIHVGDTIVPESNFATLTGMTNTIMHRNIYRGKNLGTSVTTAQLDAISNGTFDDIYVGDYWVINGTTYVIVDIDYYYGIGDISKMSKHHVVIVPKNISTFAAMNTTRSYKPYYYARNAISELATLRNTIKTDFGSTNVLTYENRFLDSNGTDGTPNSSATARDASIELMNEIQIFGLNIVSPQKINSIIFYDNRQFAGFKLNPSLYLPNIDTTDYTGYWTRDYANSSSYSAVMNYGHAEDWFADLQLGLRPYFLLGKSAS